MPRFLMTICYDGTDYHGWQVQPNAVTVQPTVQDALEKIIGARPSVTGCSRTDSGVHANMYCLHFDYDGTIPPQSLVKAVNTKLPDDIAAVSCKEVADDFHARYDVRSKRYVYKMYNGAVRNPFCGKYSYYVNYPLDAEKMNRAAKNFIGTYDFCGFCSSGSSVEDTVRTVYDASVIRDGNMVTFSVEANGFLYNMVRIMAGTLLYVAMGKISPDEIADIIRSKDRDRAGATAPPHGLFLDKVNY